VGVNLGTLPFIPSLGTSHPVAKGLAVITGVAVFTLTFLTDHELGVIRVIPFSFRLAADFIVGVVFVISPFAQGVSSLDAWYYWINRAAVLVVISLQKPEGVRVRCCFGANSAKVTNSEQWVSRQRVSTLLSR